MAVELFGRPTPFPEGPFRLALLAEVPILPVFAARLGHGRRLVAIGTPVWPKTQLELSRRARLNALASEVARQLEAHLREFPTQWFHFASDSGQDARARGRRSARSGEETGPKRPGSTPTKVA